MAQESLKYTPPEGEYSIPKERLERYKDFVEIHSENGEYSPRLGLLGLLSTLTPDPKPIVLAGMRDGVIYESNTQLYKSTLSWLEGMGVPKKLFPITHNSTWEYCQRIEKDGTLVDGSLIKIGAVVKEAIEQTPQGLRYGYMRSPAGKELAGSLLPYAIEFVQKARESTIEHRYDSLGRILGSINSPTAQRRPLLVYDVVEFLVKNQGRHRQKDIFEALEDRGVGLGRLEYVLSFLGDYGIIDYQSPMQEREGRMGRSWSRYYLVENSQVSELLEDIGKIYTIVREKGRERMREFTNLSYLSKIVSYIKSHPNEPYDRDTMSLIYPGIINKSDISRVLTLLESIGILEKPEGGFKGRKTHSQGQANPLTHLFYDLVLTPAKYVADTLTPLPPKSLTQNQVVVFLDNYQEERSRIGSKGGVEVRGFILETLGQYGEIKLSEITQRWNGQKDRALNATTFRDHLSTLASQGLVKKTKKGYYRLSGIGPTD